MLWVLEKATFQKLLLSGLTERRVSREAFISGVGVRRMPRALDSSRLCALTGFPENNLIVYRTLLLLIHDYTSKLILNFRIFDAITQTYDHNIFSSDFIPYSSVFILGNEGGLERDVLGCHRFAPIFVRAA